MSLITAILLLGTAIQVQAQDTPPESLVGRLIILNAGDLWSWQNGDLVQHTASRYIFSISLSPDGTRVAYNLAPPEILDQLDDPSFYGGVPTDIWIWDLSTDTHYPIATQPENPIVWETSKSRSRAAWSPDGTQLAYTEWNFPNIGIMVYDFANETTHLLSNQVNYGFADGSESQDQTPQWGAVVSKSVWTYLENGLAGNVLYLYDDDGTRRDYQLDNSGDTLPDQVPIQLRSLRWVEYQREWWIGLAYKDSPYRLMNPHTAEQFEVDAEPTIKMLHPSSETVLMLTLTQIDEYWSGWNVEWADGTITELGQVSIQLSPDGQSIAALRSYSDDPLRIMKNGEVVDTLEVDYPAAIAWSTTVWRLSNDATLSPVEAFNFEKITLPTPHQG